MPTPVAHSLVVGGVTRTFLELVPSVLNGAGMISLHGRYGNGQAQIDLTRFDVIANREGFVLICPDGIDKSWNSLDSPSNPLGSDDVALIDALFDRMIALYSVDPAKLYLNGMSNGAFMTERYAAERADRLAGFGTVSGEIGTELSLTFAPSRPVPAIIMHGTDDPYVPYTGGTTSSGGSTLSVDDTVARWRTRNNCVGTAEPLRINKAGSLDGTVDYFRWEGDAPVELFRINNGGHQWPSGKWILGCGTLNKDIIASEEMWRFFKGELR